MQHHLSRSADWAKLSSRAFADWFSQLEGLRSPVAVGTYDGSEGLNLAVFNSMTHIGARPPLLALVFRPLTVERHTYDNLKATGVYTINHLAAAHVDALHQTSAKYPAGVSEFDAVGLTAVSSAAGAPYVQEASVSMQLRFVEEHHVAANDCVIVIGAVEELRIVDTASFGESRLDWTSQAALVVSGLYNYYDVSHRVTKPYAKAT